MKYYSTFPAPIYVKRQRWPDCNGNDFIRTILIPYDIFKHLDGGEISPIDIRGIIIPDSIFDEIVEAITIILEMVLPSIEDGEYFDSRMIELAIEVESNIDSEIISDDILLIALMPIDLPSILDFDISEISLILDLYIDSLILDEAFSIDGEFGPIEPSSIYTLDVNEDIGIINIILDMYLESLVQNSPYIDFISTTLSLEHNISFDSIDSQDGSMLSQISYITVQRQIGPYDPNDWRWWWFEIDGPYW